MLTDSKIYKFINSWIEFNDSLVKGSTTMRYIKGGAKKLTWLWNNSSFGKMLNGFADENCIKASVSLNVIGRFLTWILDSSANGFGKIMKNAVTNSRVFCTLSKLGRTLKKRESYFQNSYISKLLLEFWSDAD